MSLTTEQSRDHKEYENAIPLVRGVVDEAYTAARKVIEAAFMTVANDDRAEALVAAIYRYIIDSAE